MDRLLRRLVASVALVVLAGMGVARSPSIVDAQDEDQPTTTIDLSPFDKPFSRGYFLIHLLGTNTMNGFVEKDTYILYPEAPKDGWFLTADGEGGTFNNKGDSLGGPFTTPRAVCGAAAGLPQQTFGVEDRYWDCALVRTGRTGGGGIGLTGVIGALAAGAAAATGIALTWNRIRNRPRPQWIPTDPGSGLTTECIQALTGLRQDVDSVLAKLSDLQLAKDGALRQAIATNEEAALLDALANPRATSAGASGAVSGGAGSVGLGTDIAGIAASAVEGSSKMAAWLADAQRKVLQGQDLRSAVTQLRSLMVADMVTRGSTLLDPATIAAYASEARNLSTAGTTAVTRVTALGSALQTLGAGLGVINLISSAVSLAYGAQQFADLELVGQWRMEAELKRAEAERWMSLAGDVTKRIADLEKDFSARVAAYNGRAALCGAKPLEPPAWSDVVSQFGAETMPAGTVNAPVNQAIQNVFPQGPDPVQNDERIDNCDRAAYDELVRDFDEAVTTRDTAFAAAQKWKTREADASATCSALNDARDKEQAFIDERRDWWAGMGIAGMAATGASFLVPPIAAIALGAASITAGVVGGAASPEDAWMVELGKMRALCTEMSQIRGAIGLEAVRRFNEAQACRANVSDRHMQLVMMHGRCSAKSAVPWPAPPPLPATPEFDPRVQGTVRPYWEILRWH